MSWLSLCQHRLRARCHAGRGDATRAQAAWYQAEPLLCPLTSHGEQQEPKGAALVARPPRVFCGLEMGENIISEPKGWWIT